MSKQLISDSTVQASGSSSFKNKYFLFLKKVLISIRHIDIVESCLCRWNTCEWHVIDRWVHMSYNWVCGRCTSRCTSGMWVVDRCLSCIWVGESVLIRIWVIGTCVWVCAKCLSSLSVWGMCGWFHSSKQEKTSNNYQIVLITCVEWLTTIIEWFGQAHIHFLSPMNE